MIQIDMPMPDDCSKCRFDTECGFCKAMPDNFCGNTDDRKRPKWCPLKEQEAVTIKRTKENVFGVYGGTCPKCHNWIQSAHTFCGFCGQAVTWE